MPLIKVILGTTRDARFGDKPANWIMQLAKEQQPDATFELVDLKEVNLPLFDEPVPPLMGDYRHDHTKAWAKIISDADGFIFVTAEYNFSIPAALKNAIDYLAAEWRYKPAAFISYGAASGGLRAVQHLREIAGNAGYIPLHDTVVFNRYWLQLNEAGELQIDDEQLEHGTKLLQNIVFWAEKLQPIREELEARKK
jgi:NAD(P)H-dependent FMN reductase